MTANLILDSSCSQELQLGPGYKWSLFENTPNWELAQAVAIEDTSKIYKIINTKKVNIDLQEPKFGRTLLMLAVSNDKEKSTETLLKAGASVMLRDSMDNQAINEATNYIELKNHSLNILKLLISYGADVNAFSSKGPYAVPLESAVTSFSCAKLLLDNGANAYYKNRIDNTSYNSYSVWVFLLLNNTDSSIFVAKYMILEKKMLIPNPISWTMGVNNPIDIFLMLNNLNFSKDPKKQEAKDEIINYLHQIDFPRNGVYR